jgi:cytochrome c5
MPTGIFKNSFLFVLVQFWLPTSLFERVITRSPVFHEKIDWNGLATMEDRIYVGNSLGKYQIYGIIRGLSYRENPILPVKKGGTEYLAQDYNFQTTYQMIKYPSITAACGISLLLSFNAYATHNSPEELEARVSAVGQISIGNAAQGDGGSSSGEPQDGATVYGASCAACHDSGVGGAPVAGDVDDWEDRIEEGLEILVDHALNGFQGSAGVMPPKGGNPALSDAEVTAAVEHMVGLVDPSAVPSEAVASDAAASETDTGEPMAEAPVDGAGVYNTACMACHAAGVAGAPKLGDAEGWSARIDQGAETLVEHAIQGFQGGSGFMPAKGGNPSLSDQEVAAAVQYMVDQSQ